MGRLSNSWNVFKQSLGVLKKDKELAVLPIFSAIASVLILLTFIFPAQFTGLLERAAQEEPIDENARYTVYALALAVYLVLSFITIYFQAALISGAMERLSGGDPTVGSALRGANKRLGKIFAWSLVAATVSLLIHMIEEALRKGGNRFAAGIFSMVFGTAWALLTYFVIPVVLFEDKGAFASLGRSGKLFKQRWGESLIGEYGIGMIVGLFTFLGILVAGGIAFYTFSIGLVPVAITFVVVGVLWILAMSIIGTSLGGIYKAALYKFAKDGEVVPYFTPDSIRGAYHPQHASPSRL